MRDSREGEREREWGGGWRGAGKDSDKRDRVAMWKGRNWKGNSMQKKQDVEMGCCFVDNWLFVYLCVCVHVCQRAAVVCSAGLWFFITTIEPHRGVHAWLMVSADTRLPWPVCLKWGTPGFNCKGHIGNESWQKKERESDRERRSVLQWMTIKWAEMRPSVVSLEVQQLCSVYSWHILHLWWWPHVISKKIIIIFNCMYYTVGYLFSDAPNLQPHIISSAHWLDFILIFCPECSLLSYSSSPVKWKNLGKSTTLLDSLFSFEHTQIHPYTHKHGNTHRL